MQAQHGKTGGILCEHHSGGNQQDPAYTGEEDRIRASSPTLANQQKKK